jgi:hypothetical protein
MTQDDHLLPHIVHPAPLLMGWWSQEDDIDLVQNLHEVNLKL